MIKFKILFNKTPGAVFTEIPYTEDPQVPPGCALFVQGQKIWILHFGDGTMERYPKLEPLELEDQTEDCHMTWEAFCQGVESRCFTDDDGFGELATDVMKSDVVINPSDVPSSKKSPHAWATHVVWYNK
jgi:hypothetical protein